MASMLCRRAFQRQTAVAFRVAQNSRGLHFTASVQKKKGRAIDTAFDEDAFGEDAFGSESEVITSGASSTSTNAPTALSSKKVQKPKLTAEEREKRFFDMLTFLSARIGRRPSIKLPPRNTTWVHLIQLAQSPAELRQIADLFPLWREFGRDFGDSISGIFVRRCQELKDPELALDVFGDYAKYGLKLNLDSARQLVYSLQTEHPLEKTVQATALFSIYGLPDVSEDLPISSMVAAACFAEANKGGETAGEAAKLGQAMLPSIKELVAEKRDMRKVQGDGPRKWTRWALGEVEKALLNGKGGHDFQGAKWLREWRAKHGYALN